MAVGRITKRSVEGVALPVGTARAYLWDDVLKGFGVMVTASGSRSYLVQYQIGGRGAPTRRATIGRHGSPWTAERARDEASDLLHMVRKGIDPVDEARRRNAEVVEGRKTSRHLAFDHYVDLFGKKYLDANNLRSAEDIKSVFRRDLTPVFKGRSINTLRRAEISDCLDTISERSKSAAVKAHKWLRKMLAWAVDRGDLATSPMESMSPPHRDGQRKRVLRGDELHAVWAASGVMGEPFCSFVRMLILTGQRLREVAGMNWSEINLEVGEWTLPGERTKNARDHLCPLSPQAIALLRERFPDDGLRKGLVFTTNGKSPISGFSKAKIKLSGETTKALAMLQPDTAQPSVMQPWVYHDLRRSFSTGCQALGFPIDHTEACLNHVSGKRGGLAAIYQLHEYKSEKAEVLNAWGRHVEALLARSSKSKIIPIAAARSEKAAIRAKRASDG